jgi:hypothetical protein
MQIVFEYFPKDLLHTLMTYDVLGTTIRSVPRQGAEWNFEVVNARIFQVFALFVANVLLVGIFIPTDFKNGEAEEFEFDIYISSCFGFMESKTV